MNEHTKRLGRVEAAPEFKGILIKVRNRLLPHAPL
jgi:hypothetical protein